MEFDFVSSYTHYNRTAVKKGKKWGFIDQNSKLIVPTIYDSIKNYQNGFAEVCQNGKWGFIDLNGKEICELKYSQVYPFNNDYAIVCCTSAYNLITRGGNELFENSYTSIYKLSDGNFCLRDSSKECHLFITSSHKIISGKFTDIYCIKPGVYECIGIAGNCSITSEGNYIY